MICKGLSVWIQTVDEGQLPEYQTNIIDNHTIECWIPSTEGSNFEVAFQSLDSPYHDLDLHCRPQLDGRDFRGRVLPADDIKRGKYNTIEGEAFDTSTIRLFSFGKRLLTDRDDIASSKKPQKGLNTIRATLEWGLSGNPKLQSRFKHPKENGLIHEKVAKKGHAGSAELGKFTEISYRPTITSFKKTGRAKPVVFIFHYGPEDWLRARGIIPSENTSQKRLRDTTPECIDVDGLETDDDEIVVIRHMIPVPVTSGSKRQKTGQVAQPKIEP